MACQCCRTGSAPYYVSSKEKTAKVHWKNPMKCVEGTDFELVRKVPAHVSSPHDFHVGNTTIYYTYKYGNHRMTCVVEIEVKGN